MRNPFVKARSIPGHDRGIDRTGDPLQRSVTGLPESELDTSKQEVDRLRFPPRPHARVDGGTIEARHGPAHHPDAILTLGEAAFIAVISGGRPFADLIASGAASASGDAEAVRRLRGLFRLPSARFRP
ncbi:hypothetical protein [Amycolatopsis sp. cmx-4-68]|uniref:hypothetical protein n=1 Tax=Amycolatopsis sp. cmx-4-68 TaxID=2790938 RepID=UPI00397AF0E0